MNQRELVGGEVQWGQCEFTQSIGFRDYCTSATANRIVCLVLYQGSLTCLAVQQVPLIERAFRIHYFSFCFYKLSNKFFCLTLISPIYSYMTLQACFWIIFGLAANKNLRNGYSAVLRNRSETKPSPSTRGILKIPVKTCFWWTPYVWSSSEK